MCIPFLPFPPQVNPPTPPHKKSTRVLPKFSRWHILVSLPLGISRKHILYTVIASFELMSSLARVIRNNGSLYEVKRLQFIFAWDLAAACIIGVSVIAGFPQDESCLFSAL